MVEKSKREADGELWNFRLCFKKREKSTGRNEKQGNEERREKKRRRKREKGKKNLARS